MRDNKLFPSNLQNNGLIGNRKDGSKNPSKLPNINQSVRMGDSVLSHDSEAAKRISQDLTLKFMKSASRTDGRKLANKSEISQNEKDVDNKTLRGHEAEIKQPNNVVPSVPKNEPVAEIKPKENPPVPLPVIEHSDNKGGENIKSDLVKPIENKENGSKTPQILPSENENSQLNFANMINNIIYFKNLELKMMP